MGIDWEEILGCDGDDMTDAYESLVYETNEVCASEDNNEIKKELFIGR